MIKPSAWRSKFRAAFAGLRQSIQTQNSFWIHLPVAATVLATSTILRFEPWRWTVLIIVIVIVITAELFNTAIEHLIQVVHPEHHERIGHSLDAAAAGVLVATMGAIAVGFIVILPPLMEFVGITI